MANRFRWNDDLSSDPFSDPSYSVNSGSSGWTYSGANDRLENTTGGTVAAFLTLLNSKNQSGIVETDVQYFGSTGSNHTAIILRAFGYLLFVGENSGSKYIGICLEDSAIDTVLTNISTASIAYVTEALTGSFTMKAIGTPSGVDFYIDDHLKFSTVPKKVSSDVSVQCYRNGGGSGGTIFVSRLLVKADSSLPDAPTTVSPSLAGALTSSTGPIIVQVPTSRLYLDLGASFSGRIGADGLANVVYDPGGANVSMSEDTGISDVAGGTNGDYYLEVPARGVASDYRLVIKEEFVTTNSVVVTDTIGFDIVGGPTGQTAAVKQEDDVHCYVEKSYSSVFLNPPVSLRTDLGITPTLHNSNADGNTTHITNGGYSALFDNLLDTGAQADYLEFDSTVNFPILIDIDLGKSYSLHSLGLTTRAFSDSRAYIGDVNIYSNTVPFSGSSLAQGTLEASNYPVFIEQANTVTPFYGNRGQQAKDTPLTSPLLNITTRYLRIVAVSSAHFVGSTSRFRMFGEIEVRLNNLSINSSANNGQFEFDSGSGYTSFPGGGVTQDGGFVRVTLPASMAHDGSTPNYYRVYFKPDITD